MPASIAAFVVVFTALSESTTTSSAVPTASTTTVVASTVLPVSTATSSIVTAPQINTSTAESSSTITGVAVTGSSGSNLPGSTYVASTHAATPPVIVVYSQDALKRYDGSSSPKVFMDHFDIVADVNGWKTGLDKLNHLKVAFDGRAALQIKGLDDPAKAFAALRRQLISHFGSPNEVQIARRQFGRRLQLEGEAIDEYADALLKLNGAGWSGLTLEQRETELQNQFVDGLCQPELQEHLRLQYADLGFDETVKKARYYIEVKDTSKPKKAFVRFDSAKREPTVNVITPSTVDLEPVINCLQDIKGRMDKMEGRGQLARSSTPPSRPTSPVTPQLQGNQRGRLSLRSQNDNTGNRRVQFEGQQP